MKTENKRVWEVVGSLALVAVVAVPFFSFAKGGNKTYYVNASASGSQDGSKDHPYQSIAKALDKATKGDTVNVAKGTYKENVTLPYKVKLVGAGSGKTIIKSDDRDNAVVTMKDQTKLQGVTVKNGKVGVVVKDGATADITDSKVTGNRHEGIVALKASTGENGQLNVIDTDVSGNGWNGLWSAQRNVVLIGSDFDGNGRNGVAFETGVKAWIKNTSMSNNDQNGLYAKLDRANITLTKGNKIRKNDQNGVLTQSFGSMGHVSIAATRISENKGFGVAKQGAATGKGVSVQNLEKFFGNTAGNVSGILK